MGSMWFISAMLSADFGTGHSQNLLNFRTTLFWIFLPLALECYRRQQILVFCKDKTINECCHLLLWRAIGLLFQEFLRTFFPVNHIPIVEPVFVFLMWLGGIWGLTSSMELVDVLGIIDSSSCGARWTFFTVEAVGQSLLVWPKSPHPQQALHSFLECPVLPQFRQTLALFVIWIPELGELLEFVLQSCPIWVEAVISSFMVSGK